MKTKKIFVILILFLLFFNYTPVFAENINNDLALNSKYAILIEATTRNYSIF